MRDIHTPQVGGPASVTGRFQDARVAHSGAHLRNDGLVQPRHWLHLDLLKFIWLCGVLLRRGKGLILGQVVPELDLLPSANERNGAGRVSALRRVYVERLPTTQTTTNDFHA